MRIIIHPDGKIESLENEVTRALGLTDRKRVSHVEPANRFLRFVFRTIRNRVRDDSKIACWTRTWRCRWQANIFDGPTLGPYARRQDAIAAEIEFIEERLLGETHEFNAVECNHNARGSGCHNQTAGKAEGGF